MNPVINRIPVTTANGLCIVLIKKKKDSQVYCAELITNKGEKTGIRTHHTRSKNSSETDVINELVARTVEKFNNTYERYSAVKIDYKEIFEEMTNEYGINLVCSPTWRAESTKKSAIAFFRQNTASLISQYINSPNSEENSPENIQQEILEIVKKNQAKKTANNKSPNSNLASDSKAEAIANRHIDEANIIYEASRRHLQQYDLPSLQIPQILVDNFTVTEQVKALSRETLIKLAHKFWQEIPEESLAVGAIIMLCCLTRTSETCPKFSEIADCGDYGVYSILSQANGTVRIPELKTTSSARIIILPKFAMDAVRERRKVLISKGFSEDIIKKAYVVSKNDDPLTMQPSENLSQYVRRKMEEIGLKEDYWRSVSALVNQEPDFDEFGAKLGDLQAYILRRSGCTYLVNCTSCPTYPYGAPSALVDALMGHKLAEKDSKWVDWLRRKDNQPLVAGMLEGIIHDPSHSANPAFSQKQTIFKTEIAQICHVVQRFIASPDDEKADEIRLQIRSHGAETLRIRLPHGASLKKEIIPQSRQDSFLPYIQEETDLEYYKKILKEPDKPKGNKSQ